MDPLFWFVILGTVLGLTVRLSFLQADFRRYPTTPNGLLIQVTVGAIAATMGAVTIPALIAKNYVAVTFLALAIQQLRQVRTAEQNSLKNLEGTEFAPRGSAYVDEIAKGFEARNYLALIVGLATTGSATLLRSALGDPVLAGTVGVALGALAGTALRRYSQVKSVGDVAEIIEAPISFKGYDLFVGDVYVMNIGLQATRDHINEQGLAVIIKPRNIDGQVSLASAGQRRAIMSDVSRVLGTERYIRTRRDFDTDEVALLIVPIRKDKGLVLETVKETPLLEVVRRAHS